MCPLRLSVSIVSHCHSDAGASRCDSILELSNFPVADVHDIVSSYWVTSINQYDECDASLRLTLQLRGWVDMFVFFT